MHTSGSMVRIVRVRRPRRRPISSNRVAPSEVLGYLQRAVSNFDALGITQGAVVNTGMLISLFRQPPPEKQQYSSNSAPSPRREKRLKKRVPLGERISRFIEDRRVYGAQPHSLPEFALLGVIVIVSVWPMLSLMAAMETFR